MVIGAPMIAAAVADPASYLGRAAGATFAPGAPLDLSAHWLRTLGVFVLTGDPNPRHDVAELPLLGWPLATLAVVGVVRLWRRRREPAEAFVLWSLPIFLLPPLVATEGGAPHFLRALGLAAPLAVAIGLGVHELIQFALARWGPRPSRAVAVAEAVLLVAVALGSGQAYLSRPVADRCDAYSYDLVAMAGLAGPRDLVILDDYTASVVRFLDGARSPTVVPPGRPLMPDAARVLALTLEDLEIAVGVAATEHAVPVAENPRGDPAVWAVEP